jgi:hypothetical protein
MFTKQWVDAGARGSNDPVIEARKAPFVFANDLRLEVAAH